eukprot:814199-Amphidinium_carterae.2
MLLNVEKWSTYEKLKTEIENITSAQIAANSSTSPMDLGTFYSQQGKGNKGNRGECGGKGHQAKDCRALPCRSVQCRGEPECVPTELMASTQGDTGTAIAAYEAAQDAHYGHQYELAISKKIVDKRLVTFASRISGRERLMCARKTRVKKGLLSVADHVASDHRVVFNQEGGGCRTDIHAPSKREKDNHKSNGHIPYRAACVRGKGLGHQDSHRRTREPGESKIF